MWKSLKAALSDNLSILAYIRCPGLTTLGVCSNIRWRQSNRQLWDNLSPGKVLAQLSIDTGLCPEEKNYTSYKEMNIYGFLKVLFNIITLCPCYLNKRMGLLWKSYGASNSELVEGLLDLNCNNTVIAPKFPPPSFRTYYFSWEVETRLQECPIILLKMLQMQSYTSPILQSVMKY